MHDEAELARAFTAAYRHGEAAESVRRALLCDASRALEPARFERLIQACWRRGDVAERCAVLRALPDLADPARHLPIASSGVRTNVLPIFEAIAAENRYPAAHFSDDQLNQMVIKAIFLGVRVDRIVDLDRRKSPTLARMAADFASERRAAGRPVPPDAISLANHSSERAPR